MIRAVLDTNVYVAALLSRSGAPARLVTALSDGLFDAVVCPHLIDELSGVLARPKITKHVEPEVAIQFVEWLRRVAVSAPDPETIAPISPDPGDDYLIALALASQVKVIVSGDAHLLDLTDPPVHVLTPAMFADLVESLR